MADGMRPYDNGTGLSEEALARKALFPGLVYNEQGQPAEVAYIGGVAHYAIP
ncbi:MAG: hypothetical protein H5T70_09800, partial [Chloroflexi bacterium]|nr:hypothetical protein [Chloroflexota bacterium]